MIPDPILDESLSEVQTLSVDLPVPCERRIGAAGTGKTFSLLKDVADNPSYGLLTSTTGISAVNLGAITIHSTLRYSTTNVLRDKFLSGHLQRTLHSIAKKYRRLIIEEYSMSDAAQLDLWYRGVQEANRYSDVPQPMGIMLVGDLAQLPPVNAPWCFRANHWNAFADNTTKLEKVYRQEGGQFLDALNFLRTGDGGPASELLTAAGIRWNTCIDPDFEGTSIFSSNKKVDRYNKFGMDRIKSPFLYSEARFWGRLRNEWQEHIPGKLELKIGALVMVLSNAKDFSYVNGDTGIIVDYLGESDEYIIKLKRTGADMPIGRIVREYDLPGRPEPWTGDTILESDDDGKWYPKPHYRSKYKRYVIGQVEYHPLRPAWASTVHKSQSLTLDSVQVDFRDRFFGNPAMLYVALSRCRTLDGLRLIGPKEIFVNRCAVDKEILPWI